MYSPPLYENIKICVINSLYGANANKYFRLFNINIARAITSNTRFYVNLLNYRINEYMKSIGCPYDVVIYNDTDSQYFTLKHVIDTQYQGPDDVIAKTEFLDKWIKENLDPVIQRCNDELGDILNAYEPGAIQAEREAIADKGVFLAKKRYFLRVYDMEGVKYSKEHPYMKRMGIDIIRSSTPTFVKENLNESINIILDNEREDVINWIKTIKHKFTEVPLQEIGKTTSVNSLMYEIGDKGIPINSRASIASNNYIKNNPELAQKYNTIAAGDKIKILYLVKNNPVGENVLAFTDGKFAELFREYVDFDTCWDKYFISPLNIMIEPLGWDMNNTSQSVDEW